MSLLVFKHYKKLNDKRKRLLFARQTILLRSNKFIDEIERNTPTINMKEEISLLRFFDKLLQYFYGMHFYEELLIEILANNGNDQNNGWEEHIIDKIKNAEQNLENLFKEKEI